MFNSPFDFFAIVIAIVAFIVARKAMNQVAALRAQLESMQRLATAVAAESRFRPRSRRRRRPSKPRCHPH